MSYNIKQPLPQQLSTASGHQLVYHPICSWSNDVEPCANIFIYYNSRFLHTVCKYTALKHDGGYDACRNVVPSSELASVKWIVTRLCIQLSPQSYQHDPDTRPWRLQLWSFPVLSCATCLPAGHVV